MKVFFSLDRNLSHILWTEGVEELEGMEKIFEKHFFFC